MKRDEEADRCCKREWWIFSLSSTSKQLVTIVMDARTKSKWTRTIFGMHIKQVLIHVQFILVIHLFLFWFYIQKKKETKLIETFCADIL